MMKGTARRQVTGFGYEHDEAWAANLEMFKHFTDVTQGVRRLGAAAVDLCHVALGAVPRFGVCVQHASKSVLLPQVWFLCARLAPRFMGDTLYASERALLP